MIERSNRCLAFFHFFPGVVAVYTCTIYLMFIEFGIFNDTLWNITRALESLFIIEIILNFVTTYIDPESLENITDIKQIVKHYVFRGEFLMHLIAVFPYYLLKPRIEYLEHNDY